MDSKFVFPFLLPGMNKMLRMRRHEHLSWKDKCFNIILDQKERMHHGKVRIIYTRYASRMMDDDNLHSTKKFLLDALVQAAIIKDDSGEYITESETLQKKCPRKDARTEVVIQDIKPE